MKKYRVQKILNNMMNQSAIESYMGDLKDNEKRRPYLSGLPGQ